MNSHCIRAVYTDEIIRVYQAYNHQIANAAVKNGTLECPVFSMTRMTWIKPSYLWMMYRAGWGMKDGNQTRILAIDIARSGFEWALRHSCLSKMPAGMEKERWRAFLDAYPVRVQWDPERDIHHAPLDVRSIQIGLSGEAVSRYVREWIRNIEDVTERSHEIHSLVASGRNEEAIAMLPDERVYPFDFSGLPGHALLAASQDSLPDLIQRLQP